jgi:hypothetical protein
MEVVPTTCLPRSRACPLARARCTCARTRAEVVHALAQVTESGHKVAAPHSLQRTALGLMDDPGQNPRQLYTQTALDCTRLVYATCNVCVRRNSRSESNITVSLQKIFAQQKDNCSIWVFVLRQSHYVDLRIEWYHHVYLFVMYRNS